MPRARAPWSARAFGVELAFAFDVPALHNAAVERAADPTSFELADTAVLPAGEGRPLAWMPDGCGGAVVEVREYPGVGILVDGGASGRFRIRPDVRQVVCVPGAGPWQQVLIAQVLPLVAALRGLHVMHASAVSFGDGAIAIAGACGAGKSTLAAELAGAGHPMLAEDVLALRLDRGTPIAEPGVSRPELPRAPGALPLRALYLLGDAEPGASPIEPVPAPPATDLMSTTFVPYLSGGVGHLELAAAMARSVAVARVRVDRRRPARELAMRVERFAESAKGPAPFLPA